MEIPGAHSRATEYRPRHQKNIKDLHYNIDIDIHTHSTVTRCHVGTPVSY
jgi:hypothetical protein